MFTSLSYGVFYLSDVFIGISASGSQPREADDSAASEDSRVVRLDAGIPVIFQIPALILFCFV